MQNPFEVKQNDQKEKKPVHVNVNIGKSRNNTRSRFKTNITDQVSKRNRMYNVPIDVICYVKELYARHTTWHDIVLNTKDQYPNLELTERRIKQIYEKNKSEFKEAREEYKKLIESEFKDDREALFGTTLKAEQALASSYLEEIERMKEGLSMLDPVEDTKEYTALLSAIHKAQQSLEKIANTDRFRRLEENKQRLEQVKELKESLPSGERSGEEPLQINIIGHE